MNTLPAAAVRPSRRVLAGVVVLLALLSLAALPPAPAAAASYAVPSGLKAVAATPTSVSLAWAAVAKAPRYRVQYSASARMAAPTYRRFTGTSGQLSGLTAATTYYVRVRVITADGGNLSAYSRPVAVRTAPAPTAPVPTGLRATTLTPSTATLVWNAVPRAPRYRIQYSTSSTMTSPTYVRVTGTTRRLSGLTAATTYYAKVRVITADGGNLSAYSPAVRLRTMSSTTYPAPVGLTAAAVTQTTAALTWAAVPGAPRYRVQYSTSASMADAASVSVGSPRATLTGLTSFTTYHVRVAVTTTGGESLSAASPVVQLKTAPVVAPLQVGSYNIRCVNCFAGLTDELPWSGRKAAVVAAIKAQDLDVVGLQEASQAWLRDADGKLYSESQYEDLLQGLGAPWKLTNTKRNNCVRDTTPTDCVHRDQGASQGTRILYNADRVEVVRSGSKLLPSKDALQPSSRYLAWAVLRQRATRQEFFFADAHFEADHALYALRAEEAAVTVATIRERNTEDLPVIAVGDWNSHRFATPTNAPYDAFVAAGLTDPIGGAYASTTAVAPTAEIRTRTWLNSFNGFARQARGYRSWDNGLYLDYMLTTPMRVSAWETVADLDSADRFVGVIPSDHNLVRMTVYLPW